MNFQPSLQQEGQNATSSELIEINISPPEDSSLITGTKFLRKRQPKKVNSQEDTLINCHHCRQIKSLNDVLVCKNEFCRESYCLQCVKKYYARLYHRGKNIYSVQRSAQRKEWECYKCGKRCLCSRCNKDVGDENKDKNTNEGYSHLENKINKVEINEKGIIKIIMKKKKRKSSSRRSRLRTQSKVKNSNTSLQKKNNKKDQLHKNILFDDSLEKNTIIINNSSIIEIKKPPEELAKQNNHLDGTSENLYSTSQNEKNRSIYSDKDSMALIESSKHDVDLIPRKKNFIDKRQNSSSLLELKDDALIQSIVAGTNITTTQESQSKHSQNKAEKRLRDKLYKIAGLCEFYYKKKCKARYLKKECIICRNSDFHINELLRFKNVEDFLNYLRYLFKYMKSVIDYKKRTSEENREDIFEYYKKYTSEKHSDWNFRLPKIICKFCLIKAVNYPNCLLFFKSVFIDDNTPIQKSSTQSNKMLGDTIRQNGEIITWKSKNEPKDNHIHVKLTFDKNKKNQFPKKDIKSEKGQKRTQIPESNVFDKVFNKNSIMFNDTQQNIQNDYFNSQLLSQLYDKSNRVIQCILELKRYPYNREPIQRIVEYTQGYINALSELLKHYESIMAVQLKIKYQILNDYSLKSKDNQRFLELYNQFLQQIDENKKDSCIIIQLVNQLIYYGSNCLNTFFSMSNLHL